MKKLVVGAACAIAMAAVLLGGLQKAVQADGAIVIKNDGPCGMAGSDADGNLIFGGIGQVTTSVTNGNKQMIKCKGEDITNLSGRGQSFRDFACGTPSGVTQDSHATCFSQRSGDVNLHGPLLVTSR